MNMPYFLATLWANHNPFHRCSKIKIIFDIKLLKKLTKKNIKSPKCGIVIYSFEQSLDLSGDKPELTIHWRRNTVRREFSLSKESKWIPQEVSKILVIMLNVLPGDFITVKICRKLKEVSIGKAPLLCKDFWKLRLMVASMKLSTHITELELEPVKFKWK